MANFFDKVSDVINNTANDISDKAKEYSEVSSLKGQIRSQEKIVEATYREIGKSYFDAHKDETDNPFYGQMSKIIDAQNKIASLNDDINNIKNK